MALRSLFLDFNSYFASVEQQERPELRGRPVIVTPVEAETTGAIAVSREAKLLGVRRGMRVSEARRICRSLAVILARPPIYLDYHDRLKKAVDLVAPVETVHSIDEMACTLPHGFTGPDRARELALAVKRSIAERIGAYVRCSIGIAPNAFLAKAACEMQKPDGLTILESESLPESLYGLKLRAFAGIGPSVEARLHHAGIHTVEQLCHMPRARFRKIWGSVEGERIHDLLHGRGAHRPAGRKALISHSHVLAPAQRNDATALAVLHRLLQKAATRLRREQHYARGLGFFIEFPGSDTYSAELAFRETQDTIELTSALRRLWEQRPHRREPPRMVGVSLMNLLSEPQRTLPLFHTEADARHARLGAAMDALNARYGKNTVYFGAAHTALDSAPMRIAFNYIPSPGD